MSSRKHNNTWPLFPTRHHLSNVHIIKHELDTGFWSIKKIILILIPLKQVSRVLNGFIYHVMLKAKL